MRLRPTGAVYDALPDPVDVWGGGHLSHFPPLNPLLLRHLDSGHLWRLYTLPNTAGYKSLPMDIECFLVNDVYF